MTSLGECDKVDVKTVLSNCVIHHEKFIYISYKFLLGVLNTSNLEFI